MESGGDRKMMWKSKLESLWWRCDGIARMNRTKAHESTYRNHIYCRKAPVWFEIDFYRPPEL